MSTRPTQQQQKAGLGGLAVSTVTLVVALLAFAAGGLAGFIFAGRPGAAELVRFLVDQGADGVAMFVTFVMALVVIVVVRLPHVQNFMGSAYNNYRAIQDEGARNKTGVLGSQVELAKAYAFSSSLTTAAILWFIGVIVAAQIIARALIRALIQ